MVFLRTPFGRLAGLFAAVALLIVTLIPGISTAAAQTLSVPLVPAPRTSSGGSGTVALATNGAVQIDLTGARSSTTYNLSLCYNTGVAYSCTAGGSITTDSGGSFQGSVAASEAPIDLVLLVNSGDPIDAYQAVTGSVPEAPTDVTSPDQSGASDMIGTLPASTP